MPLRFINDTDSSSPESLFSDIKYYNADDEKYYLLTDPQTNLEIKVKYIPKFESDRDPNRYDCLLFENPYLIAENDVFEIYESTIEGRLGWIFPISALDSNENNYAENTSFRHYRHIAYQKLLNLDYGVNLSGTKEEYLLSEIFQGISVFIISKDEIANLGSFKITDYALSFLKYDYLIYKDSFNGKRSFTKAREIDDLRKGNHKLKIKKSAFDITSNQYTKSLFIDHVYQTENTLTKYILLYQILEQFIQEYGDNLLEDIITEYQDRKITKNTLKEKIGKLSNDRSLVKKPFEKAVIKTETKEAFLEKCTFLFTDLGLIVSQNFEDAIYDLRNLITHSYRMLTTKTEELDDLIYLFELVILDLLINYNEKPSKPVAESNPTSLDNMKRTSFSKPTAEPTGLKIKAIRFWNNMLQRLVISV